MSRMKKVLPVLLTLTMLTAGAAPVFADADSSEKEEVIYVNLDGSGEVKEIYAVNIFGSGQITDYGDYSSVKMLNTGDTITQNNDRITFSTDAERVYYEGIMKTKLLPWKISIHYYMDGDEYSAEEIAGMSGKLEIHFLVEKDPDCRGEFFENYALQASFTLDAEKCKNIEAEDAAIVNVGSDKQLSYTMLPGKGIDTVITADVTDFEMNAVSINGIPLSLNVEVDDEELLERVKELQDAIEQLSDGAGELQSGAKELSDGANGKLQSGTKELSDGAEQLIGGAGALKSGGSLVNDGAKSLQGGADLLDSGIVSLNSGLTQIQDALNQLNEKSAELNGGSEQMKQALLQIQSELSKVSGSAEEIGTLVDASSRIRNGIAELTAGIEELEKNVSYQAFTNVKAQNGLDVDSLQEGNCTAIESLTSLEGTLNAQIAKIREMQNVIGSESPLASQLEELLVQLQTMDGQLQQMIFLFQGNNAYIQGTEIYLDAVNDSIWQLLDGANTLKTSYEEFDAGIREMADTLETMLYQMSELQSAISQLAAEYSNLDGGIREYTDGVARIVAGYSQVSGGALELSKGSRELKDGTDRLYGGTAELLSSLTEFYDAAGSFSDGTGELEDGVQELLLGISKLSSGTEELKEGTDQLRGETDDMDTEISNKIDEMIQSITGDNSEIVSFVSEKNTNVTAVQFVIQTEEICVPEKEAAKETEEKSTGFFEKLIALFRKSQKE